MLAETNPDCSKMLPTAERLEETVVAELGENKKIFQNVDLYSGIIYHGTTAYSGRVPFTLANLTANMYLWRIDSRLRTSISQRFWWERYSNVSAFR